MDTGTESISCATFNNHDVIVNDLVSCDDVATARVFYKDGLTLDIETLTSEPLTPEPVTLTANNSCHCLYDTGVRVNAYTQAEVTCTELGGHLPEADTASRLQVSCAGLNRSLN